MIKEKNLTVRSWKDYELIDSGDNKKLERYGEFTLIRPETQALWAPSQPDAWKKANAEFVWADGKGVWRKKFIKEPWEFSWEDIHCTLELTSFKHLGVFPEQAENWRWIKERIAGLAEGREEHRSEKPVRVLNLFGYTGAASIAAAKSGAEVTHVDASRQSNEWAKENATRSEVPQENIRYILDDALKFVEREVRRGAEYEGIILDPPAFGRGAKGEVWRVEEDLSKLLAALAKIFSKKEGAFFLLNGYASGYSPQSFLQAVQHFFPPAKMSGEFGELRLQETASAARYISSGIYVRFAR
ncbi:MAG TPA: class I SAM-dependent methyltransferase [Candidatus Paceibacterota bacterium]|jgi:23S rRNA (cytosine1962-C5)-methyltransferase|nr:class I SAM-dependent methyltransferase [Candidatus Paceibacterota bacterium]